MTDAPTQPTPRAAGRIARNVLSNWGGYVFSVAINFFLAPLVVRYLGNSGYGVWTLIVSLTGYLGLLDFGVRGAVTRYTAKFHTEADHEKAGGVASSALLIFVVAGAMAILLSAVLGLFFTGAFNVPPEYRRVAALVMTLAGLSVAVSLVSGVFGGITVGLQRFDLSNALEAGVAALRAVAILATLRAGKGIVALALVHLIFTVARAAAAAIVAFKLYPELRIGPGRVSRSHLKLISTFSMFSFLYYVGNNLIYYTDSVVIGTYLPVGMITIFVIGANLVEYARSLVTGISQTMSPLASVLEAKGDMQELSRWLLLGCRTATMVALPVAVTFMLRGGSFIGLWMGAQYANPSGRILWILSFSLGLWPACHLAAAIMFGIGKHKPLVPLMVAEGLSNLVLSIVGVRYMGIEGVAWGTAVPSLASSLLFWPWYIRRALGVTPAAYVLSSWIRPGVAIVPFALASYAVERRWPASNLPIYFVQVAVLMPLALLGYWLVCLDRGQRESVRRHVLRLLTPRPFDT